jgi:hypothetical protein
MHHPSRDSVRILALYNGKGPTPRQAVQAVGGQNGGDQRSCEARSLTDCRTKYRQAHTIRVAKNVGLYRDAGEAHTPNLSILPSKNARRKAARYGK